MSFDLPEGIDKFVFGIRLAPHSAFVGMKFAVQFGDGPVLVSPAMYDLLSHADGEEFDLLLKAIPLKRLPALPAIDKMDLVPFI